MITGIYAGAIGLMLVFLIARIAARRRKYQVGIGDGGIPDLAQAIRVHGNFVETVPLMILLLGIMEFNLVPPIFLHLYGAGIILSRLLHANGLNHTPLLSFGRKYGTILTLLLLLIGSLTTILSYLL